jgi:hypothetical protein
MIKVFVVALMLAGGAEAKSFSCELPWIRWATNCSKEMFSIRSQETLTIQVTSIKDSDAKEVGGCPEVQVIDQNNGNKVLATFTVCRGESKDYTAPKGSAELIVRFSASMEGWGSVTIKGNSIVMSGK